MKKLLVLLMFVLPGAAFGAPDDCTVVEFTDHFEVVCEGDGTRIPVPTVAYEKAADTGDSSVRSQTNEKSQDASVSGDKPETETRPSPTAAEKKRNRQGRPNSADLNAAIEARRKLIQEQRPKQ